MQILRTILTVIFAIDCIALTVVVLMQEGKQQEVMRFCSEPNTRPPQERSIRLRNM